MASNEAVDECTKFVTGIQAGERARILARIEAVTEADLIKAYEIARPRYADRPHLASLRAVKELLLAAARGEKSNG